jgi:Domain of unknown function (DUF4145)
VARKRESWDAEERAERWLGRQRRGLGPRARALQVLEETSERSKPAPPAVPAAALECTFCGVFAPHLWTNLVSLDASACLVKSPLWSAVCSNCRLPSYWLEGVDELEPRLLWPGQLLGAPPHKAMPEDVRDEYAEARAVAPRSPRAAAALLRLALAKLMSHVGQRGRFLTDGVKTLVQRGGIDPRVEQALEALRAVGDGALPPGQISLEDDEATVQALCGVLNLLVEELIEAPRRRDAVYAALPHEGTAADANGDLSAG